MLRYEIGVKSGGLFSYQEIHLWTVSVAALVGFSQCGELAGHFLEVFLWLSEELYQEF
jgi:hypothetical protein